MKLTDIELFILIKILEYIDINTLVLVKGISKFFNDFSRQNIEYISYMSLKKKYNIISNPKQNLKIHYSLEHRYLDSHKIGIFYYSLQGIIESSLDKNDLELVKLFLTNSERSTHIQYNVPSNTNWGVGYITNDISYKKTLYSAALSNCVSIMKYILNDLTPNEIYTFNILNVCSYGCIDAIRLLLTHPRIILEKSTNNDLILNGIVIHAHTSLINDALIDSSRKGYLEIVKLLLNDLRFDPGYRNNSAIIEAARNGHIEIVKLLISDSRVDPSTLGNQAFIFACSNGNLEIYNLLIQDLRVNPSETLNLPLQCASENGHIHIVKKLLHDTRVNPALPSNKSIVSAAMNGHIEIYTLLMTYPGVDPSAFNNYAIRKATQNGHTEMVRILLDEPKVDPTDFSIDQFDPDSSKSAVYIASDLDHRCILKLFLNDLRINNEKMDITYIYNNAIKFGSKVIIDLLQLNPRYSYSEMDLNQDEMV